MAQKTVAQSVYRLTWLAWCSGTWTFSLVGCRSSCQIRRSIPFPAVWWCSEGFVGWWLWTAGFFPSSQVQKQIPPTYKNIKSKTGGSVIAAITKQSEKRKKVSRDIPDRQQGCRMMRRKQSGTQSSRRTRPIRSYSAFRDFRLPFRSLCCLSLHINIQGE